MEETQTFAPLLIVIFLAFLVPLTLSRLRRFRLPIVVGEILAGILIGRSGFGWVSGHDPVLELLSEFGFVFLFFLAGTEIDFSNIVHLNNGGNNNNNRLLGVIPLSILAYALTLGLSTLAGWWLVSQGYGANAWMVGLLFATSSLGIVVAVLKEQNFSRTRLGQTILTAALIADFGTLLLFTVSVAILSRGISTEILLIGLLFVAFIFIYRFGNFFFNRLKPIPKIMEEMSTATAQIKMRAAFSLLLAFVVLAEFVGTEIVMGAFLAGAIVSLLSTPRDHEALTQLEAIGFGFFIPVFFIMIGVNFNFSALLDTEPVTFLNIPRAFLLVPLILLIAIGVKVFPALLYKFHFTWRQMFGIGVLISARLSLIVAESTIELQMGLIDDSVNAAVILTAMMLATFTPLGFNRLVEKPEEAEQAPILVIGAGELGVQIAKQLDKQGEKVLIIDSDEKLIERAKKHALPALAADPEKPGPEITPYYRQARTLINTYINGEVNFRICQLAKEVFGVENVVTSVNQPGDLPRFEQLGVTAMNPALDQAALMVLMALNPTAYELLTRTDDEKAVREIVVENAHVAGQTIRSIQFPGDVLVLALRRNGDLIVPDGTTRLDLYDHLTLVGSLEDVDEASYLFG
jgi:Kef-type K+ transport system membrane component KefB